MKTPYQTLNPVLKYLTGLYIITYKQGGRGSNPSLPTKNKPTHLSGFYYFSAYGKKMEKNINIFYHCDCNI